MRFRGLANVESAPSWKVRLLQLPAADQSFLGTINERYFGSLGFADEAEQRRLVEQGFPMPEEWMAAREVPDEELERLAKQGEIKAQMFQIDRVSERLAPVLGARGLQNTPEDKELFRQFVETTSMAEQLLRKTKSPFVAYLTGRMFSAGTLGNQPEPIAGAFELAKDLGDGRADGYRSVFVESHPGMDPEAVMASYSGMKSGVGQVAQEKRGD